MISEFRRRVQRETIDYVANLQSYNSSYLSSVSCAYRKGSSYYIATSYYTDFWISKTPTGPRSNSVDMGRLSDIAVVQEFRTEKEQTAAWFRIPKEADLTKIISEFCRVAQSKFGQFNDLCTEGDTVSWDFKPVPIPVLVATFRAKSKRLLGVIVFQQAADPFISFSASDKMLDYYLPRCRVLASGSNTIPLTGISLV